MARYQHIGLVCHRAEWWRTACLPSYSGWISSATTPQSTALLTRAVDRLRSRGFRCHPSCVATPAVSSAGHVTMSVARVHHESTEK